MGAKCSSGYELGEILLRFVVLVFQRKHKNLLVGGRGWVEKTSNNQLCFLEIWLKKPTGTFKKTWTLNGLIIPSFLKTKILDEVLFHAIFPHVRKRKKTTGSQETSEAAASELATWPWSSSSSSQAGKNSTPHGVKWGQIVSNEIVSVTQVLSSKFWLCNLFQTHTCSVFSVFVAQTCSCCYWQSTGLSSVSLLLWRIGSSILHRKLIGSFRLGIQ